jgi:hypothetical protein
MAVAVVGMVCVTALGAACGGSSGDGSTGTPAGNAGAAGMQAYVDCMTKNGVTMSVPSGGPRRAGGGGTPGAGRLSGGPLPSRAPGGGGFGGGGMQKPSNVDDATWQKAQQACATLQPTGGPGGGPGGAQAPSGNG